jgi:hypothetical protein
MAANAALPNTTTQVLRMNLQKATKATKSGVAAKVLNDFAGNPF